VLYPLELTIIPSLKKTYKTRLVEELVTLVCTVAHNKTHKILDFACTSRNALRRPPSVYLGVQHHFYLRNLNSSIILMIYLNNNDAVEPCWTLWLTICCTLVAHFLGAPESTLLRCQMDKLALSDQTTLTLSLTNLMVCIHDQK
jgi:hypothetical protein